MSENVNQAILEKLDKIADLQTLEAIIGYDKQEFVQRYPDVARQLVNGVKCSSKIIARGVMKGEIFLGSRFDPASGQIKYSILTPGKDIKPSQAKDMELYFKGTLIPDDVKKALYEQVSWTHSNGKYMPGRANANGGYMSVPRFENAVKEDGMQGRVPVKDEKGKTIYDSYLIGIARNGDIVGDKKTFVYSRFFAPQVDQSTGEIVKVNGDTIYDISKLNDNVYARTVYGVELSLSQCLEIAKGMPVVVKGCKNKEGREFACFVQYNPGDPDNCLSLCHPAAYSQTVRESLGVDWGSPADNKAEAQQNAQKTQAARAEAEEQKRAPRRSAKKI